MSAEHLSDHDLATVNAARKRDRDRRTDTRCNPGGGPRSPGRQSDRWEYCEQGPQRAQVRAAWEYDDRRQLKCTDDCSIQGIGRCVGIEHPGYSPPETRIVMCDANTSQALAYIRRWQGGSGPAVVTDYPVLLADTHPDSGAPILE